MMYEHNPQAYQIHAKSIYTVFHLRLLRNQWKCLLCLVSRNLSCLLQLLTPELAQIAKQQDEQKLHTWSD